MSDGISDALTGGASIIDDLIGGAFSGFEAIWGVFIFLISAQGWIRIFEVFFGGLLIFGALKYGN